MNDDGRWKTVKFDVVEGIAWVTFNRFEKRNAISQPLNKEMIGAFEAVDLDAEVQVLARTGGAIRGPSA